MIMIVTLCDISMMVQGLSFEAYRPDFSMGNCSDHSREIHIFYQHIMSLNEMYTE